MYRSWIGVYEIEAMAKQVALSTTERTPILSLLTSNHGTCWGQPDWSTRVSAHLSQAVVWQCLVELGHEQRRAIGLAVSIRNMAKMKCPVALDLGFLLADLPRFVCPFSWLSRVVKIREVKVDGRSDEAGN